MMTGTGQMQKVLTYATKLNITSLKSNVIMPVLKVFYPNK